MVAAMIAASARAHARKGGTGIKPISKRAANAPLDLIVVRMDVLYIEARPKLSRTIEFCVMQAQRCSLPGEYRMGTFDSSVPVAVQRERVSRREIDVAGESRSGPAGCRAPAARSQCVKGCATPARWLTRALTCMRLQGRHRTTLNIYGRWPTLSRGHLNVGSAPDSGQSWNT